jgi:hypothetical protein
MSNELYPHQRLAVDKMHNGCVLAGNVGTGKSLTALAYYVEKVCGGALDRSAPMRTPMDLLIVTTAKKRDSLDWFSEALHFGLSENPELSYGNVKITVDSWQNIQKYKDVEGMMVILDEQKLVGTGVWVKAFQKMAKHNQWIMLSATPADNWLDFVPLFVHADGIETDQTSSTSTWFGVSTVNIGPSAATTAFVIWHDFEMNSLWKCLSNESLYDMYLRERYYMMQKPSEASGFVDGMYSQELQSSMLQRSIA